MYYLPTRSSLAPLPGELLSSMAFFTAKSRFGIFFLTGPTQAKAVCLWKVNEGKMLYFPQPDPMSGRAIGEHRRIFGWSSNITLITCNEYAIPLMTGDKDGKQSQTYQTGIVALKWISWTKPFTATWTHQDNEEAHGSSISIANSLAVRMSVRETVPHRDRCTGRCNVSWTTAGVQSRRFSTKSTYCSEEKQPE